MFNEDQLIPISSLQHYIFCPRQAALIHVERQWAENRWTAEGRVLHKRAHDGATEIVDGVRITRSLWLKSHSLGLVGQADIVEFHADGSIVPIEYKRGKPKIDDSDRVQICAQALCLEEMRDCHVSAGYLFYGKRKRRTPVDFDKNLRDRTCSIAAQMRELIEHLHTPSAVKQQKCDTCSLLHLCLPDSMRFSSGVNAFVQRQIGRLLSSDGPTTDSSFETTP